ncbi:MAG: phage virion morphogenesis protein [Collimonas sp.]|uniref:phage virion morphogenesis protein n=1 Tax=Collimonas sp. TaxID=1963772 RepID=UPI0032664BD3
MSDKIIEVEYESQEVDAAIAGLLHAVGDLTPFYKDAGEHLVNTTKRRFETSTAPDGTPWAPNSAVTLARKKGTKPLIGETRELSTAIHYVIDADGLMVGSNKIYAAAQQFGMVRGYAGQNKRNAPIPWGDIPAREYLGLSDADEVEILALAVDHLKNAMEG